MPWTLPSGGIRCGGVRCRPRARQARTRATASPSGTGAEKTPPLAFSVRTGVTTCKAEERGAPAEELVLLSARNNGGRRAHREGAGGPVHECFLASLRFCPRSFFLAQSQMVWHDGISCTAPAGQRTPLWLTSWRRPGSTSVVGSGASAPGTSANIRRIQAKFGRPPNWPHWANFGTISAKFGRWSDSAKLGPFPRIWPQIGHTCDSVGRNWPESYRSGLGWTRPALLRFR